MRDGKNLGIVLPVEVATENEPAGVACADIEDFAPLRLANQHMAGIVRISEQKAEGIGADHRAGFAGGDFFLRGSDGGCGKRGEGSRRATGER